MLTVNNSTDNWADWLVVYRAGHSWNDSCNGYLSEVVVENSQNLQDFIHIVSRTKMLSMKRF